MKACYQCDNSSQAIPIYILIFPERQPWACTFMDPIRIFYQITLAILVFQIDFLFINVLHFITKINPLLYFFRCACVAYTTLKLYLQNELLTYNMYTDMFIEFMMLPYFQRRRKVSVCAGWENSDLWSSVQTMSAGFNGSTRSVLGSPDRQEESGFVKTANKKATDLINDIHLLGGQLNT